MNITPKELYIDHFLFLSVLRLERGHPSHHFQILQKIYISKFSTSCFAVSKNYPYEEPTTAILFVSHLFVV